MRNTPRSIDVICRTAHLRIATFLGCHPSEIAVRVSRADGDTCRTTYPRAPSCSSTGSN